MRVLTAASGIVPSDMPRRNALQTTAGEGGTADDVSAAAIHQTTIKPTMPASGGPSSLTRRLIGHPLVDLAHQELVDLGDDPRHQHVVELARAGR